MNCADVIDKKLVIETSFNDTLTRSSCVTLISEIIKYILYHKQQMPYTFDRLKYVVTKKKDIESMKKNKHVAFSNAERLFRIAEEGFTTLEILFEKTKQEILKSNNISEIVLLFGGTPLTPKQVYHIHLPEFYCNHMRTHADRKYLFQFLQSVIQSNKLNEMLMKPMGPTNMYVFIRKDVNDSTTDNLSPWFLPKNRFQIPNNGQHFHIKLSHPQFQNRTCTCKGFNVYSDDDPVISPTSSSPPKPEEGSFNSVYSSKIQTEWYQACEIFKGFKDIYVNGVSVSDSWMR